MSYKAAYIWNNGREQTYIMDNTIFFPDVLGKRSKEKVWQHER